MKLETYEEKLLHGWEETFRKGALSFWLLLSLKDGAKATAQIQAFITKHCEPMKADDQSVYRSLRRLRDAYLIDLSLKESGSGPDIKEYFLTKTGRRVLKAFIQRNITIYLKKDLQNLLKA